MSDEWAASVAIGASPKSPGGAASKTTVIDSSCCVSADGTSTKGVSPEAFSTDAVSMEGVSTDDQAEFAAPKGSGEARRLGSGIELLLDLIESSKVVGNKVAATVDASGDRLTTGPESA